MADQVDGCHQSNADIQIQSPHTIPNDSVTKSLTVDTHLKSIDQNSDDIVSPTTIPIQIEKSQNASSQRTPIATAYKLTENDDDNDADDDDDVSRLTDDFPMEPASETKVYLETPAELADNDVDGKHLLNESINKIDLNDKTSPSTSQPSVLIPKRLSDEFFSADEYDDTVELSDRDTITTLQSFKSESEPRNRLHLILEAAETVAATQLHRCQKIDQSIELDGDLKAIDAIERNDFAEECLLTSGRMRLTCQRDILDITNEDNRLNLEMLRVIEQSTTETDGNESRDGDDPTNRLATTPTSSRTSIMNVDQLSERKKNLIKSLEKSDADVSHGNDGDDNCSMKCIPDSDHNDIDALLNTNSSDSHKDTKIGTVRIATSKITVKRCQDLSTNDDAVPSTSSGCIQSNPLAIKRNSSTFSCSTSNIGSSNLNDSSTESCSYRGNDNNFHEIDDVCPLNALNDENPVANDEDTIENVTGTDDNIPAGDEQNFEQSHVLMALENDHDYDEDTWVDCEEISDIEEVCTCRDYTDDDIRASSDDELTSPNRRNISDNSLMRYKSVRPVGGGDDDQTGGASEDELPSRDVDLTEFNNLESIPEDMLQDSSVGDSTSSITPRLLRKRKMIGDKPPTTATSFGGKLLLDSSVATTNTPTSNKRLVLDCTIVTSPKLLTAGAASQQPVTPTTINQHLFICSPNSLTLSERRTPRSLIPTRDNPPPELSDWLQQFLRWSNAERLLAVDRLIEQCEPTQVRHMMKVIEPQFQRDFISLLPKELALQVLSYLDPNDLLRAAQTCRSWRFLCDDNLLWKEKCKQAGIVIEPLTDRPKRGRAGNMPPISSPWKAAYMRQHIIEMNWRSKPIREPKVLKGHDDHVITCLQFCGNRIVSGSDDNTLKVWSAITGKCLRTLVGHTGGVWSSQMAGNIIISGSTDRTLKVWNAETGQCTHTLYGHTSTVRCMHLHGNKVVSGSRDTSLRVWDITSGKCLHKLDGHLAAVRCVQYDGKLIVSGAYDYMVKVWNPEREECLHTLQGHTNRVYSLQFDGIHVVSGSLDTSIRVWDVESGSCRHTLMGHQSLTSGMELRQNILVSGNADSTVKVWDITSGQCLQTLSGPNKHQSAVTCLQFNSRFVITSSDDGTVKLWDVRTGEFIRNLVALDSGGSGGVVWRIRANDTKLICAVGSRNGTEETKLMVLDFDVEGACLKCS